MTMAMASALVLTWLDLAWLGLAWLGFLLIALIALIDSLIGGKRRGKLLQLVILSRASC